MSGGGAALPAADLAVVVWRPAHPAAPWWLRRGLRAPWQHVMAYVRVGPHWVYVDPLADGLRLLPFPAAPEHPDGVRAVILATEHRDQGHVAMVVPVSQRGGRTAYPWRPATCVETVAAAIGRPGVAITPRGLYRALQTEVLHGECV